MKISQQINQIEQIHAQEMQKSNQEITRLRKKLQAQQQSVIARPTSNKASLAMSLPIDNSIDFSNTSLFETSNCNTSYGLIAKNCLDP